MIVAVDELELPSDIREGFHKVVTELTETKYMTGAETDKIATQEMPDDKAIDIVSQIRDLYNTVEHLNS